MIGQKINNYEVRSLLGEGGMGSVYIAEHPVLGRRAAVKVLRSEFAVDSTLVARFVNEARASSAIRHPGIIEVFDVGTLADGVPYLMMELLEGETLGRRIQRDGRLTVPDAMDITAQAAAALAAAHAHGIVHRDLKPENLFLVPDPSQRSHLRVKVLDFGIAKLQRRLSGTSIRTHTGSIMGTPPYMSPEQCRGISGEIDARTDVYALGIILYEMLTGAPPFLSEGFGDVLMMHLTQPPRPPREIDPGIPPALEQVVLQALEKEPDKRLANMDELLRGLVGPAARATARQIDPSDPQYAATDVIPRLRGGRTAQSSTASELELDGEARSARRRRLVVAAVVAVGVAAIGFTAVMTGGEAPPVAVERPATRPATKQPAAPKPAAAPPAATKPAVAAPPPAAPAEQPPAPTAKEPPAAPPPPAAHDRAAAAEAPAPPPRRPAAGKPTRARLRKPAAQADRLPELLLPHPRPPVSEFAPLPDTPAGPPPAAAAPPPAKPRVSTDKW